MSEEFAAHLCDELDALGPVDHRKFFGGRALRCRGRQFAMIMGETLYFAVNEETRDPYLQRDMAPFAYTTAKGRVEVHKYYEVPGEILDDRDELLDWAKNALKAAAKPDKSSKKAAAGKKTAAGKKAATGRKNA